MGPGGGNQWALRGPPALGTGAQRAHTQAFLAVGWWSQGQGEPVPGGERSGVGLGSLGASWGVWSVRLPHRLPQEHPGRQPLRGQPRP